MGPPRYDLPDWEKDFSSLSAYIIDYESGLVPAVYLREVRDYFKRHAPESEAKFRFLRFAGAWRFVVENVQSFTVGGIASITADRIEVSEPLRYALWMSFALKTDEELLVFPDPQDVLHIAEDAAADGRFAE